MERAKRKYALITGGSTGIGYELAKLFARDDFNLVIIARDNEELARVKNELERGYQIRVVTLEKDLFNLEAPKEIYNELKAENIHIDVLVNDAGQGEYGFFDEIDIERHMDLVKLNVMAPMCLIKLFLPDMVERNEGRILNLASMLSKNPSPLLAVYAATKAFMYSLTMSLRNELQDTGVTVTALLPGATDTDFFAKAGALNTKEYHGNKSDPADVAKAGYEALMKGEEKVVASGLMNKVMSAFSNITPDSALASTMRKGMQNLDGSEGKEGASQGEGYRMAASDKMRDDDKDERKNINNTDFEDSRHAPGE